MAKLDGLETVLDFLKGLQPKIAAQIAKKVLAPLGVLQEIWNRIGWANTKNSAD